MIGIGRAVLDVLVASLWQGACITVISGMILAYAGGRLNAATRYIVLQCVLASMILVPLMTALPQAHSHDVTAPPSAAQNDVSRSDVRGQSIIPRRLDVPAVFPRINIASNDRLLVVIVVAWIAGILFFGLRIVAGALQLGRLVRRSRRLGDRGRVRLYASPDLTVPLAFGLMTPSVIVPATLAATGGEEFECILLHELAHVRRRDAWSNAAERVLHAILFFNPAVWFVLRGIALEREAACDDWAVAQSHDLDTYTRSLASFAVWGADYRNVAACGVTGFGHATVARLRRLEEAHRNRAVSISRFAIGGFATMLLAIGLSIALFAPSIAFATEAPPNGVVAAQSCSGNVRPPLMPASTPAGLDGTVEVQVAPKGNVHPAIVTHSSGNADFDKTLSSVARSFLVAFGNTTELDCAGAYPGTYYVSMQSTAAGFRWTFKHGEKAIHGFSKREGQVAQSLTPGCASAFTPPKVVQAAAVNIPNGAPRTSGVIRVIVSLDKDSHIVGRPTIQKSTVPQFNEAAIDAAVASKYLTETKNCIPYAGKFVYVVDFGSTAG
jgi:beta-lactamase regulating signal transducer with metallopeptidase domain